MAKIVRYTCDGGGVIDRENPEWSRYITQRTIVRNLNRVDELRSDRSWGDARNTQLQKDTDVMRDFLSTLEKDEWARWVEFSQAARHKAKGEEDR